MEVNKQLAKPLVLTAGILGCIQGIAWFIFAVICLSCYFGSIEDQLETPLTIGNAIYLLFLKKHDNINDFIATPDVFSIFAWIYVFLSFVWAVESAFMIWSMMHNKWEKAKYMLNIWAGITILISILDAILLIIVAKDFGTIDRANLLVRDAFAVVFSLAARGYVLWIINIIFSAVMIKFAHNFVKFEKNSSARPIIYGYDNPSNPPWHNGESLYNSVGTPRAYDNQGLENESRIFERSESFYPATMPIENQNNFTTPPSLNKVAKIGKPPGRGNLNNVPPPTVPPIPEPDYTPPGSPNPLKSVLRQTSNY